MKALFLTKYGLRIRKNLIIKEKTLAPLGSHDVLITIHAAGLNPVDYKIVYGMAFILNRPQRPFAIGFDLSGVITKIGKEVKGFKIGDEVYAKVPWHQMGTVSEQLVVEENAVSIKPKNITFEEAAGMPLVACTVYDAFQVAEIKKGTKVLITGGSGGIGTFAIQYAKALGACVYTTTSTKNIALVKSLGADEVIDYTKEDFRKNLKELDVVFDAIGGSYPWKSTAVVKRGGKIISVAGHHDNATLKKVNVAKIFRWGFLIKGSLLMLKMKRNKIYYKHVWSYPNKEKLDLIRTYVESGQIKPIVDKVFSFEDSIKGLEYLETKRARGKVIVKIK